MARTYRWVDVAQAQAYWGTITGQEESIETNSMKMEGVRGFQPHGDYPVIQQDNHHKKLDQVSLNTQRVAGIVARVRGLVQDFATRVYYEALFGSVAEGIFEQYRLEVDAALSATAAD